MTNQFRVLFSLLLMISAPALLAADSDAPSPEFMEVLSSHCHRCLDQSLATYQRCAGCNQAYYCNKDCQRAAWPYHKQWCNRYKTLATAQTVTESDLTQQFSREVIEQESYKIFEQTFKATYGLKATLLTKDTFYDQLAVRSNVAPALLYQSLKAMKETTGITIAAAGQILLPGVGYLSSAEAKAIQLSLGNEHLSGFDIDEKAIVGTCLANPELAAGMKFGDGLVDDTWKNIAQENVAAVLLIHPLFCEIIEQKKSINKIGKTMLRHIKTYLPGKPVIIISKSLSEREAYIGELSALGFEIMTALDNKERAFPCYGFGYNLVRNAPSIEFNCETSIASQMKNISDRSQYIVTALRERAEQRYRFIILAKSPVS